MAPACDVQPGIPLPPVHWPDWQTWPAAQAWPQAPQSLVLLSMSTQTPPPQSSDPAGQPQTPLAHCCPVAQRFPHWPQFKSSVLVITQALPQNVQHALPSLVQQRPAPHEGNSAGQTSPQPPQFAALVCRSTQAPPVPFALRQSVWPAAHAHTPETQLATPQLTSQAPQWLSSVCRSTHAPSHAVQQAPAMHAAPGAQVTPQPPQFCRSLSRSMQLAPPQVGQHWPWTQLARAPSPASGAQVFPQPPQLAGSRAVSMQTAPHWVPVQAQTPALHTWPWPHALPQKPQLLASLRRSRQAAPHLLKPVGQTQLPATHDSPDAQRLPQPPQLSGSVCTLAQTSVGWPGGPHALSPPPQPATHSVSKQVCPAGQTRPQPPQFRASDDGSTQASPHITQHWSPAQQAGSISGSGLVVSNGVRLHVAPALQAAPHAPQLLGSFSGLTTSPLQKMNSPATLQTPSLHCVNGEGQAWPQAPQLATSLIVSTQVGSGVLHRDGCDGGQAHLPSKQSNGSSQTLPHPPQLTRSWRVSVQPSPQSARQHLARRHWNPPHELPQTPQLPRSDSTSTVWPPQSK
jgi:hypothetical protein